MLEQIDSVSDEPCSQRAASEHTLFLAWHDRTHTRQWFPVGRLDVRADEPEYRFRYIGGAARAQDEVGFPLLLDFPDIKGDYQSSEIFPLFQNRIMSDKRRDFHNYLQTLDLPPSNANPIKILAASGGRRVTDSYEVFPEIVKLDDGSFTCRFFLHGARYTNESARNRLDSLEKGEDLIVALELNNPATTLAVQIQTTDYHMIGWAPRYLIDDLVMAMAESPGKYEARVARINPKPAPSAHRLLIEMSGRWKKHKPMSSDDYTPMVR